MKKRLFCTFIFVIIGCNNQNDQKITENSQKITALRLNNNSNAFDLSFQTLLTSYFNLKDQLMAEDDSGVAKSARALILASDSLKLDELQADSNLINTARTYSDGISAEVMGLLGENNLLSKRRSFQMVSDQLYDLIRTVQYKQKVLYHFYCEKAFDDQGAYWISDKLTIENPYLSKSSAACGAIKDTIQFHSFGL